ncbi:MAG: stage II sporulation protein D [Oscillibacter sp.]|nr:stage II sporulation protein D [Oscillibacter sp.]
MRREPSGLLGPVLLVSTVLTAALFLTPLAAIRLRRESAAAPEEPIGETGSSAAVEPDPQDAESQDVPPAPSPDASPRDAAAMLRVLDGGSVRETSLGQYLAGVLRGEMPASFEMEALKAQAVAARTYTLRMVLDGGKHGGEADICTDSTHCQAYKSEEAARQDWGGRAEEYEAKIEAAVSATDGEVILYGGEPILAVFHSSSPGLTQEVGQVWGGEQPYLKAVSSPENADAVPNYYSRAEFTASAFKEKVRASFPAADLSGSMGGWLTGAERNSAGTVETIQVGGVSMRGQQLRTALGLRSACFTWEVSDGKLVFYVTAYGHGVGMSQYGANQMAKDGADYRTILTHYYTGVAIGPYDGA